MILNTIPYIDLNFKCLKNTDNNDALSDAPNDALNDAVKNRLVKELTLIYSNNGITLKEIIDSFDIKRATAQRDVKQLKNIGWVIFKGHSKIGKYLLTEKEEKVLKKTIL